MGKFSPYSNKGLTLVEVVVATGIIMAFLTTLITVHNAYLRSSFSNLAAVKASYLLEEGVEVVKSIRSLSWTTNIAPLTNGVPYYLVFSSGTWTTTTTPVFIDSRFVRTVTFSAVNRDGTSDITTSGGSVDLGTRLVTVGVSWADSGATTTRSIDTYITNIFSN